MQIEQIASSQPDSDIRLRTRALLPGMAKRLRAVGAAAPAVAALAANSSEEAVVSSTYGGTAAPSDSAAAAAVDAVFAVLGSQILDLGGKLRNEVLDSEQGPPRLREAVATIDGLLALLPQQTVAEAQQLRADARAAKPSSL